MAEIEPDISDIIRSKGWRQGFFIALEDAGKAHSCAVDHKPELTEGDLLAIVSQDCDILGKLENEPFIEVILGSVTTKKDKAIHNRRNPRILQVEISMGNYVNFNINNRFRLKKEKFSGLSIHNYMKIEGNSLTILQKWLADRYKRPAFPDSFNNRLKKVDKQLKKYYKASSLIAMILLEVTKEELPDTESYDCKAIFSFETDIPDNVNELTESFEKLLGSCNICVEAEAYLEDDVTLSILRGYKRLSLDHFSTSDEPTSPDNNELT